MPPDSASIPSAPRPDTKPPLGLFLSLRFAWNLGYIIALPVVVFGFGGALTDKKFGTSPLFVITGFVLAAVLSGIGVYRRLTEITRAGK